MLLKNVIASFFLFEFSFGMEPNQPDPSRNPNHPPYHYRVVEGGEISTFGAEIE